MRDKSVSFTTLERAYWRFVERTCPHPIHSRHRYTWLRANRLFEHEGLSWERSSISRSADMGSAAPGAHLITFIGPDGAVVQEWLSAGPITRVA